MSNELPIRVTLVARTSNDKRHTPPGEHTLLIGRNAISTVCCLNGVLSVTSETFRSVKQP
jgi:hypothetical protein